MSFITIHKQPQDLSPVYNQMIIAVTGSSQDNPNHNFIAELLVNGSPVSRLKIPTNPEGYGVFDIHKHIENQIHYDFYPEQNGLFPATNSFATYSVKIGEEYRYDWEFYDNAFTTGAFIGFIGPNGGPEPYFNIGDLINVSQDEPFTNFSYEGQAQITDIFFVTASNAWLVNTNKSWGVNTPPEGGTITLANYQLTLDKPILLIDKQFAWNGVYNYLDFIDYDYRNYIPSPQVSGTPISINSWANNGGNLRVNGFSAHGLLIGDLVQISGAPYDYNGIWEVISTQTSTSFTVNKAYVGGDLTGGETFAKSPRPLAQWLTNVPQNWKLFEDDRMWLLAYKTASNQQKDLIFESNKGKFRITSIYSSLVESNDSYRFIYAGVGPWNIINGSASWTAMGGATFPMIDANTVTYSVSYNNQILQQDTETRVFNIKKRCSKFEKIQLVFIDKLGSWIPYTFNMINRHNKNMTRTDYQQIYGNYAPASQAWEYNSWDRGRKSLDLVITESYTINSDWVSQTTSNFLMELFESPEVYWIKEDGTSVAVNITSNNVERKQTINDQVINYTLTFELSNKNNVQRG